MFFLQLIKLKLFIQLLFSLFHYIKPFDIGFIVIIWFGNLGISFLIFHCYIVLGTNLTSGSFFFWEFWWFGLGRHITSNWNSDVNFDVNRCFVSSLFQLFVKIYFFLIPAIYFTFIWLFLICEPFSVYYFVKITFSVSMVFSWKWFHFILLN